MKRNAEKAVCKKCHKYFKKEEAHIALIVPEKEVDPVEIDNDPIKMMQPIGIKKFLVYCPFCGNIVDITEV